MQVEFKRIWQRVRFLMSTFDASLQCIYYTLTHRCTFCCAEADSTISRTHTMHAGDDVDDDDVTDDAVVDEDGNDRVWCSCTITDRVRTANISSVVIVVVVVTVVVCRRCTLLHRVQGMFVCVCSRARLSAAMTVPTETGFRISICARARVFIRNVRARTPPPPSHRRAGHVTRLKRHQSKTQRTTRALLSLAAMPNTHQSHLTARWPRGRTTPTTHGISTAALQMQQTPPHTHTAAPRIIRAYTRQYGRSGRIYRRRRFSVDGHALRRWS